MMQFAESLAQRSTCKRKQVGCVITDRHRHEVVGLGYNGNAKGLPNTCDSNVPGQCMCVHAEQNAMLKAPGSLEGKVLYTTLSPCVTCAKLILNSNISKVYFRESYRDNEGSRLLERQGIKVYAMPFIPSSVSPSENPFKECCHDNEKRLEFIRSMCHIAFYPPGNGLTEYPIEHTNRANKDMWDVLMHYADQWIAEVYTIKKVTP